MWFTFYFIIKTRQNEKCSANCIIYVYRWYVGNERINDKAAENSIVWKIEGRGRRREYTNEIKPQSTADVN